MYDIFLFLFILSCTSLNCIYYLFEAWPNKVILYIIELQLPCFFCFFSENTFTIAKLINSCMLLLQNEKKKLFSLTSSILLFKHYILYYLLCLFHYTKIQVHLLILSINVKWMYNQLFHLMAWSDFRWSISVAINITKMLSWQIIPKKTQNKPICLYSPKLCSKPQEQNSTFTSVILYDIQWRLMNLL